MHIKNVSKEELGLLILGLRAISVIDQEELHTKLLIQLENELSTRFGMKLAQQQEWWRRELESNKA